MVLILRWLFPLTILAFAGPTILFLSAVLSARERWIFLALLALRLMFVSLRLGNSIVFYLLLFLYAFWNICTSYWSESYQLSLYKSLLYAALSFSMLAAGQVWSSQQDLRRCFDCFIPLAIIVYAAAVLGYFISPIAFDGGNFRGLVSNSNMFGSFVAMTLPLLFFRLNCDWEQPRRRWLWIIACSVAITLLVMSRSRAAFLFAFCCMSGGMLVLPWRKVMIAVISAIVLVSVVAVIRPGLVSGLKDHFITKHKLEAVGDSTSIFASRDEVWSASLEKAFLGGVIGAGFGVSAGSGTWESNALVTTNYGREKGNSQLAIMEETGIVGLLLYAIMLLYLFTVLIYRFCMTRDKHLKMALGLATGALAGSMLQSVFEATWTSPGAMESVFFWALSGCALGMLSHGQSRKLKSCIQ